MIVIDILHCCAFMKRNSDGDKTVLAALRSILRQVQFTNDVRFQGLYILTLQISYLQTSTCFVSYYSINISFYPIFLLFPSAFQIILSSLRSLSNELCSGECQRLNIRSPTERYRPLLIHTTFALLYSNCQTAVQEPNIRSQQRSFS
jgi:hypothetical protein